MPPISNRGEPRGFRRFFATLWRAARQLFHEVTGALFAVYAMAGCVAAWREYSHGLISWLFGVTLLYAVMMAWFAFDAFRSARHTR